MITLKILEQYHIVRDRVRDPAYRDVLVKRISNEKSLSILSLGCLQIQPPGSLRGLLLDDWSDYVLINRKSFLVVPPTLEGGPIVANPKYVLTRPEWIRDYEAEYIGVYYSSGDEIVLNLKEGGGFTKLLHCEIFNPFYNANEFSYYIGYSFQVTNVDTDSATKGVSLVLSTTDLNEYGAIKGDNLLVINATLTYSTITRPIYVRLKKDGATNTLIESTWDADLDWHIISVRYNKDNNKLSLYFDDVLKGEYENMPQLSDTLNYAFFRATAAAPYDIHIDNLRIFQE